MLKKKKNNLFAIPSVTAPSNPLTQGGASGNYVTKYLAMHCQKLADLERDLKRLPEAEEFFFLQSDNSFNAFTFIPWVCRATSIKHLHAVTYSVNQRVINSLVELHTSGKIDKITLLVSDTLLKRNPLTVDILTATNHQYPNIEVIFAWVHAKVALIQTDKAHYVLEGSGNWSENAYYEQYVFANSKGVYDFRKKLFTDVELRYKALHGKTVKL